MTETTQPEKKPEEPKLLGEIYRKLHRLERLVVLVVILSIALPVGYFVMTLKLTRGLTPSTIEHELDLMPGELAVFRRCLEERGGSCQEGGATSPLLHSRDAEGELAPVDTGFSGQLAASVDDLAAAHPAKQARDVLAHPFLQKTLGLYNQMRGLEPPASQGSQATGEHSTWLSLEADFAELRGFLTLLRSSVLGSGWKALGKHVDDHRQQQGEADRAGDHARTLAFIDAYLSAYFDRGDYIQIELDAEELDRLLDAADDHAADELDAYLEERFPAICGPSAAMSRCKALADRLRRRLRDTVAHDQQTLYVLGRISGPGYVSRQGTMFKLPDVTAQLDPLGDEPLDLVPVNPVELGGELMIILLQAIFDAHEGLPAVSNATGIHVGTEEEAFGLPVFRSPTGHVDLAAFDEIDRLSQRATVTVKNALAQSLDSIAILGLDNPALEEVIIAAVGTVLQEATVKAGWCWYACGFQAQLEAAEAAAGQDAANISSQAKQRYFDEEARHVKLKLTVR